MEYGIAFDLFMVFVRRLIQDKLNSFDKTTTKGARRAQRIRRAQTLLARGSVHPVPDQEGSYYVPSMSREKTIYLVSKGHCKCEDSSNRSNVVCSHRIACYFYEKAKAELKGWAQDIATNTDKAITQVHFIRFTSYEARDNFVQAALEQKLAFGMQVTQAEFLPDAQLSNVTREQVSALYGLAASFGGMHLHGTSLLPSSDVRIQEQRASLH